MDQQIDIEDPFARRLLARYLERRRADLARLREALANNDFATVELTGHNLSGSGAAYGLESVSRFGAKLEAAAQAMDADRAGDVLDALEEYVSSVTVSGST